MVPLIVEFQSEHELYQCYMPFLKEGGLFVRTNHNYELGNEVEINILLPDSLEPSMIKGEVCWLTPAGAQNGTPAGIGVSFTVDKDKIKHQIEQVLARQLNSSDATLTM